MRTGLTKTQSFPLLITARQINAAHLRETLAMEKEPKVSLQVHYSKLGTARCYLTCTQAYSVSGRRGKLVVLSARDGQYQI